VNTNEGLNEVDSHDEIRELTVADLERVGGGGHTVQHEPGNQ
jgi:hypothetical protein